jgi:hypothetical protein
VTGEGATVNQTAGLYNSSNVLSAQTVSTTLASANFSANNATRLTNYSLPTSAAGAGSILAKTLNVIYTGIDKVYDGSSSASVTTSDDRVSGDALTISRTANFVSPNVAYQAQQVVSQTVNVSGVSLSGAAASNYSVSGTGTANAKITPKSLSATLVGSIQKTYDGTTDATLASGNYGITGFVSGEGASVTKTTGNYNSRNVRDVNSVTTSLASTDFAANVGTLLTNYSLPTFASGAGSIGLRTLNVSYTGVNKVYDGGTAAAVTTTDDRVSGDSLVIQRTASFTDKNVAYDNANQVTAKAVHVMGVSLGGGDASNYSVSSTGAASAQITPKSLVAGFSGVSKNYDGTPSATVTSAVDGVSQGDAARLSYQSASFADGTPGVGKPIAVSGVALTGADAGNYTLGGQTTTTAYGSIILPTGCAGSCSQTTASAPVVMPGSVNASSAPLVSGANAAAIKQSASQNEVTFQIPATAKPIAPSAVVPTTPLEPTLSVTNVSQVRGLSTDQVASLAPAKLAELMPVMTPKQLMAVTPDQMAGLDATQLNQLVSLMDSALSKMKR